MNLPFSNWEILFYCLCSATPCVAMAAYTFREHERYSHRRTLLCSAILVAAQTAITFVYFHSPISLGVIVDVAGGIIYFTFLVYLFRLPASMLLFYLLAYSSFSNFFVVMGKHLECMISATMAAQRYRWTFSLCVLTVEVICLPILYFLFFKPFCSLHRDGTDSRLWHYLWLAPATFYLIWTLWFYAFPTSVIERSAGNSYWISKLLIDAGSLLIYRLIFMLVEDHQDKMSLLEETHAQNQQLAQYAALMDRMESIRTIRHDIRHHLGVIRQYAEKGNSEQICSYIDGLLEKPDLKHPLTYCKNQAGNAVLQYYAYEAARAAITCDIRIVMPEDFFVESTDITVMIGNLFTNAVEACLREEFDHPVITVRGRPQSDSIYTFSIDNPSSVTPKADSKGHFLSHHHEGTGLGLASVQSIVDKYGGHMQIVCENGSFRVSLMLCRP